MNLRTRLREGTYRRLKSVMAEAPWSNHDLLSGLILFFIGGLLLVNPQLYTELRTLTFIIRYGYPTGWSLFFLAGGVYGLTVTLWCITPPFCMRIMARMVYAFCFLTLAFSSLRFAVTPSVVAFSLIALWSVWGILRTHESGR